MSKSKKSLVRRASTPEVIRPLSESDQAHLSEFEGLRNQVRDRAIGVALGYQCGFYLVGRAGTGKTFTVEETLRSTGKSFLSQNARMTPMGLFGLLEQYPNHTIVLDDVTELFKKVEAQQIFLAALDGEPREPRSVPYVRDRGHKTVYFRGGIIAISNLPLSQDPVLNALKSRLIPLEFEPTDDQVAAFLRRLALDGFDSMSVAECQQVVEFIIDESKKCGQRLDLRHLKKSYRDYQQHRDRKATTHWHDLVRSGLQQRIVTESMSHAQQISDHERKVALDLSTEFPKRSQKKLRDDAWVSRTGKSVDTLYRRLREIKAAKLN